MIWTTLRPILFLIALSTSLSLYGQPPVLEPRLIASIDPIRDIFPEEPLPQSSATPALQSQSTSSDSPQSSTTPPATQGSAIPSTSADEKTKKELQREEAEKELKLQHKQRMVGVIPNFNSVMNGKAVPLSPGQKMRSAFRSAIDPYQFALAGFTSAIGQANDSHSSIDENGVRHGYEQGWTGYAKRYGASYADQFDGTMIGNGILPVLFRQDPRYYRLGDGTKGRRFFYAVISAVRCKGDNGKWQPSYANVLGNLAAGGISNLYYPEADRGFGLTVRQAVIVTAEGAIGSLIVEFYPDVMNHVFHKGPKPAQNPATPVQ